MEADDDEVAEEDAEDEFASYFSQSTSPKVIITTSRKPSGEMFKFLENLFRHPNAYYYARRAYTVKEIQKHAEARGFTDVLVFNENKKFSHGARVNGLLHVHLPEGPTCLYRLSSLVLTKKIKNHGRATNHYPELILNNFSTRVGHRVGRMFASVFPQRPEFNGRRVVTFHNQRDFIFFRHHRYIFETRAGKKRAHQGHLATAEVLRKPEARGRSAEARRRRRWRSAPEEDSRRRDDDEATRGDDDTRRRTSRTPSDGVNGAAKSAGAKEAARRGWRRRDLRAGAAAGARPAIHAQADVRAEGHVRQRARRARIRAQRRDGRDQAQQAQVRVVTTARTRDAEPRNVSSASPTTFLPSATSVGVDAGVSIVRSNHTHCEHRVRACVYVALPVRIVARRGPSLIRT